MLERATGLISDPSKSCPTFSGFDYGGRVQNPAFTLPSGCLVVIDELSDVS